MSNEKRISLEEARRNVNNYKFHCETMGERRCYGICLYLIGAYRRGEIKPETGDLHEECATAMAHDKCPAMKMEAEERAAGYALYYEPILGTPERPETPNLDYIKRLGAKSASYQRGWQKVEDRLRNKTLAPLEMIKKKPGQMDDVLDMDMGRMINDMMDMMGEGRDDDDK